MADASLRFFVDGKAYERLMGRFTVAAGEAFLDWLSLPAGLEWLDVGCGTGAFTNLVLERCAPATIAAIDPSEQQIAYARTTPAAKQVDFRVGDAQSLPFAGSAFDVGIMALVITFVPDPAKAVAELKRVTRPRGTIAAYMWDFLNRSSPMQPMRDAVEAIGVQVPIQPGHLHSGMGNMEGYWRSAGLADIATRVIEVDVTYPDFEEFWTAQTALPNYVVQRIQKMNAAEVERLKAHLRASLPKDARGRIAYKARANAVRGRAPA